MLLYSSGEGVIASMTCLPKRRTLSYPFERGIAGILSLPKGRALHRFLREGCYLTPLKKGGIAGMSLLPKGRTLP